MTRSRSDIARAHSWRHLPQIRRHAVVVALACTLIPLAGCSSGNRGFAGAEEALTQSDAPLAWTVNNARATHRLDTSSLESKDAAPGSQFIVLDVSVRNRDANPQVLPEGRLIAVNESQLQTFDTPVTLLSDDYLSLQVLAPAQSMRGKIAYEVPEHLSGVLYWIPGNGSKRILLTVATPPAPQRTLASVDDDVAAETNVLAPRIASDAGQSGALKRASPQVQSDSGPKREGDVADAPPSADRPTRAAMPVAASAPVKAPLPPSPTPTFEQPPSRAVAFAAATASVPVGGPIPAPSRTVAMQAQSDKEQTRQLSCQGLVSRNDPTEKEANLGFFARSCRDYALPVSWRPQPAERRSLLARASDLLTRIVARPHVVLVSTCDASASPADRLICRDAQLAAMDHQLAQAVARAHEHVDDPAALQRDQDDWRERVRNACDTVGCLESAYGRRIAQLDALVPMRP